VIKTRSADTRLSASQPELITSTAWSRLTNHSCRFLSGLHKK